jgi:hypothetical protein
MFGHHRIFKKLNDRWKNYHTHREEKIIVLLTDGAASASNKLSRRSAGVFTRPNTSVLITASTAFVVFVIALGYDVYDPLHQWYSA